MTVSRDPDNISFDANGRPIAPWQGAGTRAKNRITQAVVATLGFQVLIWVVFAAEVVSGFSLLRYGLHPRSLTWLPGIVTFPFLHANFAHIAGNAGIAVVLVFLIGLSGRRALVASSGIIVLLGGVLTWIIGSGVIVGASGLIYGWVAYLVVRGFFNKSLLQILVGIGLGIAYAGMIVGFFPQPMISWQAHLCGAVAGVAAAKLTAPDHSADPSPRPIAAV